MGDFFDRFSKIPLSQKVLLMTLILAALGVGFWMFMYAPMTDEIDAKQIEVNELAQQAAELREVQANLVESQAALDLERETGNETEITLPLTPDTAVLYDMLHDTASELRPSSVGPMILHDIRREPYQRRSDYTRIPLQLTMTGTYDQALEYAWQLARLPRIVHVRGVDMGLSSRSRGVPGAPQLDITMNIEAFFRPES